MSKILITLATLILLSACNSTPPEATTGMEAVLAGTHPLLIEALADPYPVYDPDFSIVSVEHIDVPPEGTIWLLVKVKARNIVTGQIVDDSIRVKINPGVVEEDRGDGVLKYLITPLVDHIEEAVFLPDVDNQMWEDRKLFGYTLEG